MSKLRRLSVTKNGFSTKDPIDLEYRVERAKNIDSDNNYENGAESKPDEPTENGEANNIISDLIGQYQNNRNNQMKVFERFVSQVSESCQNQITTATKNEEIMIRQMHEKLSRSMHALVLVFEENHTKMEEYMTKIRQLVDLCRKELVTTKEQSSLGLKKIMDVYIKDCADIEKSKKINNEDLAKELEQKTKRLSQKLIADRRKENLEQLKKSILFQIQQDF